MNVCICLYVQQMMQKKKGKTEKKGYHVRYECKMRMEYIVYVVGGMSKQKVLDTYLCSHR